MALARTDTRCCNKSDGAAQETDAFLATPSQVGYTAYRLTRAMMKVVTLFGWSEWADLNRRPPGPEPGALPS